MYSKIKNIQIIVALLKQHNIRHIVLSAGTRHVPIAHSVENDNFFHCYSVVDERSAGYYALGLAKELGEPVAIACTSSTATCNYTPPIAEAFYQKVPILVLTGDRDPYHLDQLEDQMINQVDMYRNFCKKCVNLPVVKTDQDWWYCSRLVNEAILELTHRQPGPVQINFPINQSIEDIADASVPELPACNKISRVALETDAEIWKYRAQMLKDAKRIMVVCGSDEPAAPAAVAAFTEFAKHYNCTFVTEKVSNLKFDGAFDAYLVAESITGEVVRTVVAPDLVLFFGGNFVSRWKTMLRGQKAIFKSWYISEDGAICDPYQNLSCVFECSPAYFFNRMAAYHTNGTNDRKLYQDLQKLHDGIRMPTNVEIIAKANKYAVDDARFKNLPEPAKNTLVPEGYLSAFSAMRGLTEHIPENSLLHLSILNSTRITQMFHLPEGISVYSNIGTDGIDGSMSTFLGQCAAAGREGYLVIGDLSFFYDMNSLSIRNLGGNVHILLVNNGGGAEFYFSMGPGLLPDIDRHIAAAHSHSAREWVLSNGFDYLSARNQKEYDQQIAEFVAHSGKPVVMEIFTDKNWDIRVLKAFRRMIHQDTAARAIAKQVEAIPIVKQMVGTEVGQSLKSRLKETVKKYL